MTAFIIFFTVTPGFVYIRPPKKVEFTTRMEYGEGENLPGTEGYSSVPTNQVGKDHTELSFQ
jgi:hypothetical protein